GISIGDGVEDVLVGIRSGSPGAGEELEETAGAVGRRHVGGVETRFALRHAEHVVAVLTVTCGGGVDDLDDLVRRPTVGAVDGAAAPAATEGEVVAVGPAPVAVVDHTVETVGLVAGEIHVRAARHDQDDRVARTRSAPEIQRRIDRGGAPPTAGRPPPPAVAGPAGAAVHGIPQAPCG